MYILYSVIHTMLVTVLVVTITVFVQFMMRIPLHQLKSMKFQRKVSLKLSQT